MRPVQIGVIGSMADKKLSKQVQNLASSIGEEIAISNATLVFSFEEDFNSLPMIAAKSCEEKGGKSVAFIHGEKINNIENDSIRINTGQLRGGGREFSFILSCDAIIALGGGSGTLMEITMAYQAGIPVIALQNSGGWSSKLASTFLDKRKRVKIVNAKTVREAVRKAIKLTRKL